MGISPKKWHLPRAICFSRAHTPVGALGDTERWRQQPARGHRGALRGLGRQSPPQRLCAWCRKSRNFLNRIGTQPSCKPRFPARACCLRGWISCRGWRRRRWHRHPGYRVGTLDLRDGSSNRTTRTMEPNLRRVNSNSQFQICLCNGLFEATRLVSSKLARPS